MSRKTICLLFKSFFFKSFLFLITLYHKNLKLNQTNLCNSNDKENEWDNRDTEENSWEDHTNNVGDNEYKSSYQPWQQQPALS